MAAIDNSHRSHLRVRMVFQVKERAGQETVLRLYSIHKSHAQLKSRSHSDIESDSLTGKPTCSLTKRIHLKSLTNRVKCGFLLWSLFKMLTRLLHECQSIQIMQSGRCRPSESLPIDADSTLSSFFVQESKHTQVSATKISGLKSPYPIIAADLRVLASAT